MAKNTGRSQRSVKPPGAKAPADKEKAVPARNVALLKDALGVDVAGPPQDMLALVHSMTRSMSASPYTSPEMLGEYRDKGFPELVDKIINTIDQQNVHRQSLETIQTKGAEARENRGQLGAQIIAGTGLIGALIGGHFGVPTWICVVVVVVSIGGPNTATIVARFLDRGDRS